MRKAVCFVLALVLMCSVFVITAAADEENGEYTVQAQIPVSTLQVASIAEYTDRDYTAMMIL